MKVYLVKDCAFGDLGIFTTRAKAIESFKKIMAKDWKYSNSDGFIIEIEVDAPMKDYDDEEEYFLHEMEEE